jgi:hypothetical protein
LEAYRFRHGCLAYAALSRQNRPIRNKSDKPSGLERYTQRALIDDTLNVSVHSVRLPQASSRERNVLCQQRKSLVTEHPTSTSGQSHGKTHLRSSIWM